MWSLGGNKETLADQSQPSRHPFSSADWHIILWPLCQQGLISKTGMRPAGKCLWNYQREEAWERACTQMPLAVHSSTKTSYFAASIISIPYTISFCLVDHICIILHWRGFFSSFMLLLIPSSTAWLSLTSALPTNTKASACHLHFLSPLQWNKMENSDIRY